MSREELERRLDRGEQWGYVKETGDPDYLGWILLTKRLPPPVSPFDPAREQKLYASWMEWAARQRAAPYHIHVAEVRRDAHEGGGWLEEEGDYRMRQSFYAANLDEVEAILGRFGRRLSEIRHRAEINAP